MRKKTLIMILIAIPIFVYADVIDWTELTGNASWSPREDVAAVWINSAVFVIGGGLIDNGVPEVWKSYNGADWDAATLNAEFGSYISKIFNVNGTYYLYPWLNTGTDNIYSSTNMIHWTIATSSRNFLNRTGYSMCQLNGVLYLFGGWHGTEEPASYHGQHNDVWSSTDGINWACILPDATNPRDTTRPSQRLHADMINYQSKIWLLGGTDVYSNIYYNDVWSSVSGTVWTDVNDNAPFAAGGYDAVFSFNNSIYLYEHGNSGTTSGQMWSTANGVTWTVVSLDIESSFPIPRLQCGYALDSSVGYGYIFGGYIGSDVNDVWQFAIFTPSITKTVTKTATLTFTLTITPTKSITQTVTQTSSITPTPTITITVLPTVFSTWNLQGYSNIVNRIDEGYTIFNGAIYEVGGWNEYQTNLYTRVNDVWYSSDGIDWITATQNAEFSPRFGHAVVTFNNKLLILGGYALENGLEVIKNDIWKNYSANASSFTKMLSNAPWGVRYNYTVVVWNNKLWLIGGLGEGKAYSDIWASFDGYLWVPVLNNAPFGQRYGHACIVYNNMLWVIGGNDWTTGGENDVWNSSDGIHWNQVTTTTSLSKLGTYQGFVYKNRMFMIGGEDYQVNSTKSLDVFQSIDGINWYKIIGPQTINNLGHSCVVYNNAMWIIVNQGNKPVYESQ